jgi:transposase
MARVTSFLKDEQWEKLEPLLPKTAPGKRGGRPWRDNRKVLVGILWVLNSGACWRDLPARYPSSAKCWRRLRLWEDLGIWLDIWRVPLAELDERQYLDCEEAFADGSFASKKKGGSVSAKPCVAKVRSG